MLDLNLAMNKVLTNSGLKFAYKYSYWTVHSQQNLEISKSKLGP